MDTNYKIAFGAIIAVVVAVAIYGAYLYPKAAQPLGTTAVGGTFGTAKFAGVAMTPSTAGLATSSITNGSTNDYYVKSIEVGCEGVGTSKVLYTGGGLANLTLEAATTSNGIINSNTNYVGGGAFNIGTTSTWFVEASSTANATVGSILMNNIWPAGTQMTFSFNATNTAACTVGVSYISS